MVESGRRRVGDTLIDTATISRGGAAPVFDPNTGTYTPSAATTVHAGPCRVRPASLAAIGISSEAIFGDTQITTTRFSITFPHDIPNVLVGDMITITKSDDPHIGTRAFRVVAVPSTTLLMYRNFGCEVVD